MFISRKIEEDILFSIENFPVTAIIGPRQCGKSTLVKNLKFEGRDVVYLDLERSSDLQKLSDAEWYFSSQKKSLICIDEIQRNPELFPIIRALVDEWGENGKFLILGSASRELLSKSSETLAGRIVYNRMTPFLIEELNDKYSNEALLERGTFPRSILAESNKASLIWRENFITTFLERDLQLWANASPVSMRRIWQMLAHNNGQTINYSSIGNSLGVSNVTIRNYIDILESAFMIEVLNPYFANTLKRIVKAPKIYIADSGITLSLLGLSSFEQLTGHPALGGVWEQVVLSNLKGSFPNANFFFYRTAAGAEVDIVMQLNNHLYTIECKASLSPSLSKGSYIALDDIKPDHAYIVIPSDNGYSMKKDLDVVSIKELIKQLNVLN
jgi:uncharacterized protein